MQIRPVRFLPRNRSCALAVRERRVSDNDAEDRAGCHDLPVVRRLPGRLLQKRHTEREQQADRKPEQDAQRQRVDLAREPSDQEPGDDALERRADDDTGDAADAAEAAG